MINCSLIGSDGQILYTFKSSVYFFKTEGILELKLSSSYLFLVILFNCHYMLHLDFLYHLQRLNHLNPNRREKTVIK